MSKFKSLLLAHHAGDSRATQISVQQFCDAVAFRTNNNVTIADAFSSTMGTMPALLKMVIDGTADMALPTNDRLAIYSPKFACINIPFVFDDHQHADRVMDGPFSRWVAHDLEQQGLQFLSTWDWGFRQFTNSRRRLIKPADFTGLKIRVPLINQYRDVVMALGATPVWIEYSQLKELLGQQLIDGQENPIAVIDSLKIEKTQRFVSLLNYSYGTLIHIMNGDSFHRLSSEEQTTLVEESKRAGLTMRALIREQESDILSTFASSGAIIDTPDRNAFKEAIADVIQKTRHEIGIDTVDEFMTMINEAKSPTEKSFQQNNNQ